MHAACRTLRVEPLEDRLVLATFGPPAGPVAVSDDYTTPPKAGFALPESGSASTANAAKWAQVGGVATITYSFANLLDGGMRGLSVATLKSAVQEALGRWAAVAPLRFVEVADSGPAPSSVGEADYAATGQPMLRFGHVAIDGAYNILAETYYPGQTGLAGDLFFDQGESWTVNPASGIDFLEVATHEIGHALGLAHEPAASAGGADAIMNPYYGGRFRGLGTSFLYADDINGIQALYGAGVGGVIPLGSAPVAARPTDSPFAVRGNTLYVQGTAGKDAFAYVAGARPTASLNGAAYLGSWAGIASIRFDGKGGGDIATLTGGSSAERFVLSAGSAAVSGGPFSVSVVGAADIRAYGGKGDTLALHGTSANESFTASRGSALLVSGSLKAAGFGFSSVIASSGGGTDTATLNGTTGNEAFSAAPSYAKLSGSGWFVQADRFARVTAHGGGGNDSATLYDSAGNDAFASSPAQASLSGAGYSNVAVGFSSVTAHATGGYDSASFRGSAGNDSFTAGQGYAILSGAGYRDQARGFDAYSADAAQGGYDTASFSDTPGQDRFTATGNRGLFQTSIATNSIVGFRLASVRSVHGDANLYRLKDAAFSVAFSGDWRRF